MRKRYSRSYTVLSFLTMFSYREQPSAVPFFLKLRRFYYVVELLKVKQIQTDFRIKFPIHGAVQHGNYHFAGGADHGAV